MVFINLRDLLPTCFRWVDTVGKDQSCIPASHQFKFVSHNLNISHFKYDVIVHLTSEVLVR